MLDPDAPQYIPIVMPNDARALAAAPPQPALAVSSVFANNPRLDALVALCRERADLLLVDPKTPYFQFEGYLSRPDYRALPYSPGSRSALGTLWKPQRFDERAARRALIEAVFELQRRIGADLLMAPYFYVRHARHPWLQIAVGCAGEAVAATGDPVVVPVCVDIDALIDAEHRASIVGAYRGIDGAAAFWVTVINYDEHRADPADTTALFDLLAGLRAGGVPTVLSHAGRGGLVAVAAGAAGYAAGTYGLETHPRQFFREMMGSRPANTYYLEECMIHLPVRTAEAALSLDGDAGHRTCDCPACDGARQTTLMVSHTLALHSLCCRHREIRELCGVPAAQRPEQLVDRFSEALDKSAALAEALASTPGAGIRPGDFHYLEILREAAGGPKATIPLESDF